MLNIRRYTPEDAADWDRFISQSRNGTFLLYRQFMDYHADRFLDHSLVISESGRIVCLLPANYDENTATLYSHQGLTYGGLIISRRTTGAQVMESMDLIVEFCRTVLHAQRIIYKPIPYIYSSYPAEEDLYALFAHHAQLISRGLSSCIDLRHRIPFNESRKSGLRKAVNLEVRKTTDVVEFWNILNQVLTTLHTTRPVHTPQEMILLMERFPKNILLYGAYDRDGKMLAGSYVFQCGDVVHTQYLASTQEGKQCGALDKVVEHLVCHEFPECRYLDFGISTEDGGKILNKGLLFQKEGFGGRGVCYDTYELKL